MSRFASFRPSRSLSLTIGSVGLRSFLSLSLPRLSTFVRCRDRSPRGEKRDRRSSSAFLSFSLPLVHRYFASLLRPLLSALRTADHLDGRLSTHQGPTSLLPTDRLCPRRENSRSVDLLPRLAGAPSRRAGDSTAPLPLLLQLSCFFFFVFFYSSRRCRSVREINHSTTCRA